MKKTFEIIAVVLVSLLALVTIVMAASPQELTPSFVRFGIYGVADGGAGGIIPKGSLVIVDKAEDISDPYEVAVYMTDDTHSVYPMRHAIAEQAFMYLANDNFVPGNKYIGKAVFQIDWLGDAALFLYGIKWVVFAFWILAAAAYITLRIIVPKKKLAAKNAELCKKFEDFGNKFDEEESNTEY